MSRIRLKIAFIPPCALMLLLLILLLPAVTHAQYSLKGWGLSYYGELGNGSSGLFNGHPITVIDDGTGHGGEFVYISASDRSLAIKADGSLWGCGNNMNGRIGDGTTIDRNVFVVVDSGSGIGGKWVYVHAGFNHNLGIKEDGSLWAWGEGGSGALGNGGTSNSLFPINIDQGSAALGGPWIKAVAYSHSAGIRADGSLWTWGNANNYGQLGNGTTNGGQLVPTKVDDGTGKHGKWVDIAIGSYYNIALREDGSLWSWGANDFGKLGLGTAGSGTHQIAPTLVDDGTSQGGKWIFIDASPNTSIGIKEDGSLWAWGQNGYGQVGDGTTTDRHVPTLIDDGKGPGGKWVYASTSGGHTIGVKEDGSVWVWGGNFLSQLDGSTTTDRTAPFHLATIPNTINAIVEAGDAHTFVINDPPQPCLTPFGLAVQQITSSSVVAFWQTVSGMTEYDIAIDESVTTEPDPFTTILQTTDTFFQFTLLDPDKTYFVHIRTHCGGGKYSPWDSVSLKTLPLCETPFWVAADNITESTADIEWDPVVIGTSYVITVDEHDALEPGSSSDLDTVTVTVYNATNLKPATKYIAHVQTICAANNIAVWDTVSFVTEAELSVGENWNFSKRMFTIYPNPVKNILYIHSEIEGVNVTISSIEGKRLIDLQDVRQVDVSILSEGVYFISVSDKQLNPIGTGKFIKRH